MRVIGKNPAFVFLLFTTLLATCVLFGCGGSSSGQPITANSKIAFLQFNSGTGLGFETRRAEDSRFNTRGKPDPPAPMAGARISDSVNIAIGAIDAYLLDIDTGTVAALSTQSAAYTGIQLSPDGTKVVFTANDSAGYSQIFVADVNDFNNPRQLTSDDPYGHFLATFSPDGNTIGATRWNYSNPVSPTSPASSLITVPTAGGTVTAVPAPALAEAWIGGFTPDGKKIILTGFGGSYVNAGVYSMNLDGSGLTRLTNLQQETMWDSAASVSPDGMSILFSRQVGPGTTTPPPSNIYVVQIGGESTAFPAKQLTTDGYSWDAIYAGSSIAFVSSKDSQLTTKNDSLYRMDTDGTNVKELSNTTLEDCFHPY
jgi:Tol biopolymer transport system component